MYSLGDVLLDRERCSFKRKPEKNNNYNINNPPDMKMTITKMPVLPGPSWLIVAQLCQI